MTPWILTYGQGYDEAKEKVPELNRILENSDTWKNEEEKEIPRIKVVTRRAPNTKDILFKRKAIALQSNVCGTVPCTKPGEVKRGSPCQCCKLVSRSSTVTSNGTTVKTAGGNCKNNNIIYAATCKLCVKNNVYIGKTVTQLRTRVNGHRSKFYAIVRNYQNNNHFVIDPDQMDDENILGAHLYSVHNITDEKLFNENYKFDILCKCVPDNLRKNEQLYIDKLSTRKPFGLNQINSVSGT